MTDMYNMAMALERIASAMERIAETLERCEPTTTISEQLTEDEVLSILRPTDPDTPHDPP